MFVVQKELKIGEFQKLQYNSSLQLFANLLARIQKPTHKIFFQLVLLSNPRKGI